MQSGSRGLNIRAPLFLYVFDSRHPELSQLVNQSSSLLVYASISKALLRVNFILPFVMAILSLTESRSPFSISTLLTSLYRIRPSGLNPCFLGPSMSPFHSSLDIPPALFMSKILNTPPLTSSNRFRGSLS